MAPPSPREPPESVSPTEKPPKRKGSAETSSTAQSPIDYEAGLPELMLEKFSSNGSRVLRKTLSQASSLLPLEPVTSTESPVESTPSSKSSDDHGPALATGAAIPPRLQPRPRLLSPIPSTDAIPIYRGSYVQNVTSPPISRPVSVYHHSQTGTPTSTHTPRGHSRTGSAAIASPELGRKFLAMSQSYLGQFFEDKGEIRHNFGLEELRDGFFDAVFVPQSLIEKLAYQSIKGAASSANDKGSKKTVLEHAKEQVINIVRLVMIKTSGCPPFVKSFIAYGIAYILCLVHATGNWLGRFRYLMCFATILHHAGRTAGSQIEITILTLFMGALGMAWGTLAVYISTSTQPSRDGYGGILAAFGLVVIAVISWFRANFIRLYHGMIAFSTIFLCTVIFDTALWEHRWKFLWEIGMPYLFGVLVSLLVNLTVWPDFGHRSVMAGFSNVLRECATFVRAIPDKEDLTEMVESLNQYSYDLSVAFREMSTEISISTLDFKQALQLRNVIQICVGRLRIIPTAGSLLNPIRTTTQPAYILLREGFVSPIRRMMLEMAETFDLCGKYIEYLNSPTPELSEISFTDAFNDKQRILLGLQSEIVRTYRKFLYSQMLLDSDWQSQTVVDMLLFIHYITETCNTLVSVVKVFQSMVIQRRRWKLSAVNYPLHRFLRTNNRQTTHDRGGQSAFFFFHTMRDVEEVFRQLQIANQGQTPQEHNTALKKRSGMLNEANYNEKFSLSHSIWTRLHRLQQHETRFALRISITVLLLSLPAFIESSRGWYSRYDCWIAPFIALVMLHPRVGGSVHDLFVRTGTSIVGVIWATIGFRAGNGNPYVLAVFAALFSKFHITSVIPSNGFSDPCLFTICAIQPSEIRFDGMLEFYICVPFNVCDPV